MALDSQAKRMAAAGVARPYMRATLAASVNAAQRSSIGLTYPVALFSDVTAAVNRINRGNSRDLCRDICREDTDV